jgi:hypothetical protein
MNGWMDAWMDGWMGERIDAWMNGWMNGWIDAWMDRWMDGRMDGWTDGWLDGSTNGWMDRWIDVASAGLSSLGHPDILGATRDAFRHACCHAWWPFAWAKQPCLMLCDEMVFAGSVRSPGDSMTGLEHAHDSACMAKWQGNRFVSGRSRVRTPLQALLCRWRS